MYYYLLLPIYTNHYRPRCHSHYGYDVDGNKKGRKNLANWKKWSSYSIKTKHFVDTLSSLKNTWFSKHFWYWFINYKIATFDIVRWGTFDKHVSEARPASFTKTQSQLPQQHAGPITLDSWLHQDIMATYCGPISDITRAVDCVQHHTMATKCGAITDITRAVDCVQHHTMVTVCWAIADITRTVDCVQHHTMVTVCGAITDITRAVDCIQHHTMVTVCGPITDITRAVGCVQHHTMVTLCRAITNVNQAVGYILIHIHW
jgi:hypothetical protein